MAITKVSSGLISADASSIDLNIDAGTLYLDVSENRVGIGTTSPDTLLNIASSSAPTLRIENTDSTLGLNQVIGAVEFYKTDTSGGGAGVAGAMQLLSTFSTGSKTSLTFSTSNADGNNVERLRIDDSGNVGIGTTSPDFPLVVRDSTTSNYIKVISSTSGNAGIAFGDDDAELDGGLLFNNSDRALRFFGAGFSEAMRIDSSGNLNFNCTSTAGAGSSTTGVTLGSSAGGLITIHRGGATPLYVGRSNDGEVVALYSGTAQKGTISISGSTTTYGSVSDARLKDVTGSARGLEVINKLNPVSFTWKEDGKNSEGLIAQEVQELYPDAVAKMEGKDISEEEKYLTIDYGKLVTPLIKAIQEQQTIIDDLKTRIETLENV